MRNRIENILVKALHHLLNENQGIVINIGDESVIVCKELNTETNQLHLRIYDNEDPSIPHGQIINVNNSE